MNSGGFDVIIGNPPYVEYKQVCSSYEIRSYKTITCGNMFAYVLERNCVLGQICARVGMIIPLSSVSTDRMVPLIEMLKSSSEQLHIANFSWRPGRLFDGANLQLSIVLQKLQCKTPKKVFTSKYILWDSVARPELFSKVTFSESQDETLPGAIPKLGSKCATTVMNKLRAKIGQIADGINKKSSNIVYYRRGGLYWKVFVDFATDSSEEKWMTCDNSVDKYVVIAVMSSNLWFWYFTSTSDCRHLGNRDIFTFPFNPLKIKGDISRDLHNLGVRYVADLKKNAENTVRIYKKVSSVKCLSFKVKLSKPIIDEIDIVLGRYFGLTPEELDFIINYDVKFRMGADEAEDDE